MSLQQVAQPRAAMNGFSRRRTDKDVAKAEGKLLHGKASSNQLAFVGLDGGGSRERLVYLSTCLIGHNVEVQVLDGSVFSGIFHATDAEKDFGIILKMAHLMKDSTGGQKSASVSVMKPSSKTLIIPAKELVQVIAKGVPVTRSGWASDLQHDRHHELLIDSTISQSRRGDVERELERWVPDDDDPGCPELGNIFDGQWNRGWDQFEANETLFGVKSTFVEELYTTKLEKGPEMMELEREAIRIAREIEGEVTQDLHLAEERGMKLHEKYEIDEETRFSSVFRGVDDSGYDDNEDILLDSRNEETFEGGYGSVVSNSTELSSWKPADAAQASTRPYVDALQPSQSGPCNDLLDSGSDDQVPSLSFGQSTMNTIPVADNRSYENQFIEHAAGSYSNDCPLLYEESQSSKPDEFLSLCQPERESSDKVGLSANATAYAPSGSSSKGREKTSNCSDLSEGMKSSKAQGAIQSARSRVRHSSAAPSTSDCGGGQSASCGRGLSPSSSVGSLSSEKSTLNPNAKEFKLNPNAKSFVPSQTPLRPASPVADGSFYYQANIGPVAHMPGLPVGIGIAPTFATSSPVIFNPPAGPPPQPYFHPNGTQYGQQMMIGQPRQVFYMPTYAPEMPYKGRDF